MHKGQFGVRNSPINGADLVVGCPAAWGVGQSGATANTEQPGPNEPGPDWNLCRGDALIFDDSVSKLLCWTISA